MSCGLPMASSATIITKGAAMGPIVALFDLEWVFLLVSIFVSSIVIVLTIAVAAAVFGSYF